MVNVFTEKEFNMKDSRVVHNIDTQGSIPEEKINEEFKKEKINQLNYDPTKEFINTKKINTGETPKYQSYGIKKGREQGEVAATFNMLSSDVFIQNYPTTIAVSNFYIQDEKILASTTESDYFSTILSILNSKIISFKDRNGMLYKDFSVEDLIIEDFDTFLLYIRAKFCGAIIDIGYKCSDCGHYNSPSFDLRTLKIDNIKLDYKEPFIISIEGKDLKLQLPRVSSIVFSNTLQSNIDKENAILSGCLFDFDTPSEKYIEFNNLSLISKLYIKKFYSTYSFGLNPSFINKCSSCGGETSVVIPFREQGFFQSSSISEDDFRKAIKM